MLDSLTRLGGAHTMKNTAVVCQAAGGAKPFLFHTEKQTKEGC